MFLPKDRSGGRNHHSNTSWATIQTSKLDVSEDSNPYVLVFHNCLTKWPKVFPMKDWTALATIAKCLEKLVWSRNRAAEFYQMFYRTLQLFSASNV